MTTPRLPSESAKDRALEWLSRIYAGEMNKHSRAEFEAWVKASHTHREALQRAERVWELIGQTDNIESWEKELSSASPRRAGSNTPISRKWTIVIGGAIAACLLLSFTFISLSSIVSPTRTPVEYFTAISEKKSVSLEDGSVLTLDGSSRVIVSLGPDTREMALTQGRAFFEIAENPMSPMTVTAANTQVRVVGTAFGVQIGSETVRVSVAEGKVTISDATPESNTSDGISLTAGHELKANLNGNVLYQGPSNLDSALAWMDGRLAYDGVRLAEVVSDINRYRAIPLKPVGAAQDILITASFHIDQIDQFVEGLPYAYSVRLTAVPGATIIRAEAK